MLYCLLFLFEKFLLEEYQSLVHLDHPYINIVPLAQHYFRHNKRNPRMYMLKEYYVLQPKLKKNLALVIFFIML